MIEYKVKVYNDRTEWYLNGKLHREDGPAIECLNGYKLWYKNDKLHREDGPAVEHNNGHKEWYKNGKRHREDGPAIEYSDGDKFWCIDGIELTEEKFNARLNSCNGKVIEVDGKKYKLIEHKQYELPENYINLEELMYLYEKYIFKNTFIKRPNYFYQ